MADDRHVLWPVAGPEANLEHVIAYRSVAQPARAREPAREDPADRRGPYARIERALLASPRFIVLYHDADASAFTVARLSVSVVPTARSR